MSKASPNDAIRVMNGPEGDCVVARHLVGCGMVTLVGLDLGSPSVRAATRADVFWHRIFGRRGSLEGGTAETLTQGAAAPRDIAVYDADITGMIEKRGRTAGGVLLGFVVFVVYWLVAGPVGFAVLKSRKSTRHAWLAFVGASRVSLRSSPGGASLLRPGRVEASHVTFLDHVYGQPLRPAQDVGERAPSPNTATHALPSAIRPSWASGMAGVIAPWDQPQDEAVAVSFPDSRQYVVDARRMGIDARFHRDGPSSRCRRFEDGGPHGRCRGPSSRARRPKARSRSSPTRPGRRRAWSRACFATSSARCVTSSSSWFEARATSTPFLTHHGTDGGASPAEPDERRAALRQRVRL